MAVLENSFENKASELRSKIDDFATGVRAILNQKVNEIKTSPRD